MDARSGLTAIARLVSDATVLLADPVQAQADQVILQNLYRLLEMFRFDAFYDVKSKGVLELLSQEGTEYEVLEDLKQALEATSFSVFPGAKHGTVAENLEALITEMAAGRALDEALARKAKRFFEQLAVRLNA